MHIAVEQKVTSTEDRGSLAKMVMKLMDHWALSTEETGIPFGHRTD